MIHRVVMSGSITDVLTLSKSLKENGTAQSVHQKIQELKWLA